MSDEVVDIFAAAGLKKPDISSCRTNSSRGMPQRNLAVDLLQKLLKGDPAHPRDKQEKATETVLEQAEVLSEAWAMA